jgi:hypothetical protein
VWFARFPSGDSGKNNSPFTPPGNGKRNHPVAIANGKGEILTLWTEGTGWQKGGALAWQVYSSDLKPADEKGIRPDAVPTWSFGAAFPDANGDFVIVH